MTGALAVEADRIEFHAGSAVAEGHVRIAWEDQVLVGDRASLSGRVVWIEHGTWTRGTESLAFDAAEIDVDTRVGRLEAIHVAVDGAALDADVLRLQPDGRWEVEGGEVAPCACTDGGRPAITFAARSAEVVPGRVVILHGGTVRVFDVPVLPVPYWRVLLDRDRFHVLFPELTYGEPGFGARWEAAGTVDGWTIQGGPAFRQDRGLRAGLSVRGPWATGGGEVGWDWAEARVRGLGTTRGGLDRAGRRGAWDVAVASDRTYADDYAVDWVARGVGWREARVVGEAGPVRVVGWLPDDGSTGVLAQGRFRYELGRRRAWGFAPRVELGVVENVAAVPGATPVSSTLVETGYVRAGMDTRASGTWGPVHGEARADGAVTAAFARAPAGVSGRAEARVELPLWGDAGTWRVQGWIGGQAIGDVVAAPVGDTDDGASTDIEAEVGVSGSAPTWTFSEAWAPLGTEGLVRLADPPPVVRAGPSGRIEAVGPNGTVTGDLFAAWSEVGFAPSGAIGVHTAHLDVDARADTRLQRITVGARVGIVTPSVGAVRYDADVVQSWAVDALPSEPPDRSDLFLTWADVDLHPGRLRAGGGVTWDLDGDGFAGGQARLGYDDGCVSALASAGFAPDRAFPDFGVKFALRR